MFDLTHDVSILKSYCKLGQCRAYSIYGNIRVCEDSESVSYHVIATTKDLKYFNVEGTYEDVLKEMRMYFANQE